MTARKQVKKNDKLKTSKESDPIIYCSNSEEIYVASNTQFLSEENASNKELKNKSFLQKIKSLFSKKTGPNVGGKNCGLSTADIRKCIDSHIIIPHLLNSPCPPSSLQSISVHTVRELQLNNELSSENTSTFLEPEVDSQQHFGKKNHHNKTIKSPREHEIPTNYQADKEEATQTLMLTADKGIQAHSSNLDLTKNDNLIPTGKQGNSDQNEDLIPLQKSHKIKSKRKNKAANSNKKIKEVSSESLLKLNVSGSQCYKENSKINNESGEVDINFQKEKVKKRLPKLTKQYLILTNKMARIDVVSTNRTGMEKRLHEKKNKERNVNNGRYGYENFCEEKKDIRTTDNDICNGKNSNLRYEKPECSLVVKSLQASKEISKTFIEDNILNENFESNMECPVNKISEGKNYLVNGLTKHSKTMKNVSKENYKSIDKECSGVKEYEANNEELLKREQENILDRDDAKANSEEQKNKEVKCNNCQIEYNLNKTKEICQKNIKNQELFPILGNSESTVHISSSNSTDCINPRKQSSQSSPMQTEIQSSYTMEKNNKTINGVHHDLKSTSIHDANTTASFKSYQPHIHTTEKRQPFVTQPDNYIFSNMQMFTSKQVMWPTNQLYEAENNERSIRQCEKIKNDYLPDDFSKGTETYESDSTESCSQMITTKCDAYELTCENTGDDTWSYPTQSQEPTTVKYQDYKNQPKELLTNILGEVQEYRTSKKELHENVSSDLSREQTCSAFNDYNNIEEYKRVPAVDSSLDISMQQFQALMNNSYVTIHKKMMYDSGHFLRAFSNIKFEEQTVSKIDISGSEIAPAHKNLQKVNFSENISAYTYSTYTVPQSQQNTSIKKVRSHQKTNQYLKSPEGNRSPKLIKKGNKLKLFSTTQNRHHFKNIHQGTSKHLLNNSRKSPLNASPESNSIQSSTRTIRSNQFQTRELQDTKRQIINSNKKQKKSQQLMTSTCVHGVFSGNMSPLAKVNHKKK